MRPLRELLLSVAAALLGAGALLAVAARLPAPDPSTDRLRALAADAGQARLLVIGNSVADAGLDGPTLGRVLLDDADAAAVVAVPGGGPLHLHALLRGPLADARPAVVLAWLLPATWRDPTPPAGVDLARLLGLAPAGDPVIAAALYGDDPLRAAWAGLATRRVLLRDAGVQALTRLAARPAAGPERPDALFASVVGEWAPAPGRSLPPGGPGTGGGPGTRGVPADPDWPVRALVPLRDDARALGAELWLCEPVDPSGSRDSRFTHAERRAIAALGVALVATPAVDLPVTAMGPGAHVLPDWKVRATEGVGAWLRAHPPTPALTPAR